jgi:hypothetical protein
MSAVSLAMALTTTIALVAILTSDWSTVLALNAKTEPLRTVFTHAKPASPLIAQHATTTKPAKPASPASSSSTTSNAATPATTSSKTATFASPTTPATPAPKTTV